MPSSFPGFFVEAHNYQELLNLFHPFGGAGGIRTLARFYPPNPLAGGPLEPLGYRSKLYKL